MCFIKYTLLLLLLLLLLNMIHFNTATLKTEVEALNQRFKKQTLS